MSGYSPGLFAYRMGFQLCPILLTGGIADFVPGNILPITLFTEALNLAFTGGSIGPDDFFANYQPQPGSTIIDNQVAVYPFANQAVAANAQIAQPLQISLRMICPVRDPGGYAAKLVTMIALQSTLDQHNRSAGTYTIATPSFFYTDCIMTGMRDISGAESHQAQWVWQLDFLKPLLTLEQAQQAQNSLMAKLTSGQQTSDNPSWSGADAQVGSISPLAPTQPAASAAGSSIVGPQNAFTPFGGASP